MDERLVKSRARPVRLEALVHHLRHCRQCSETDVLQCPEGKALWIDAAMPFEDLQPFANGKMGCARCGAYAKPNGEVDHARDCDRYTHSAGDGG
jgi:hypothetical protein